MPKDNIERAIKKASESQDGENWEEIRYEGYGPGGVGLIVDALTDNRNRTASEVRAIFSRHGGSLGASGSVNYLFERVGLIEFSGDVAGADEVFEAAVEAGAEDVETSEHGHEIYCAAEQLHDVQKALEERFGESRGARLTWRPQTLIAVDEDAAETLFKLLDALDDNDDVQHVAGNFDVAEEFLAKLGA